mgnify:CR=1 FL=1
MKTETKIKKSGLGARASRRISNIVVYIILIAITLVWLFPFFGIVMESFKVNTKAMDGELFPEVWGFDNYIRLFKETDFLKWFLNTANWKELWVASLTARFITCPRHIWSLWKSKLYKVEKISFFIICRNSHFSQKLIQTWLTRIWSIM